MELRVHPQESPGRQQLATAPEDPAASVLPDAVDEHLARIAAPESMANAQHEELVVEVLHAQEKLDGPVPREAVDLLPALACQPPEAVPAERERELRAQNLDAMEIP